MRSFSSYFGALRMSWSPVLLLWPVLTLFVLASVTPPPAYAAPQYFMSQSTSPLAHVAGVGHTLTMGDDTPFQLVPLSFNFPFYQPTRYVWIDPNGALHMHSPTPPCCIYSPSPSTLTDLPSAVGCSFETPPQLAPSLNTTACTMDSSIGYTDLIAVSLLDLDPSHVNGSGGVRYVDSGSALLVQWLDVPWWTYNASYPIAYYSFAVVLSADGSIQFHYTEVADPTYDLETVNPLSPPINRSWLVGVRQEAWRNTETANAADYATNRTGLYPPSSWVTNGSTILFCPVDTSFCLYPTDGPLSGSTLLVLASVNMTCASVWNHTYEIVFTLASGGVVSSVAVWDSVSGTLQALTPAVNASDAGVASVSLIDTTSNAMMQLATPLYFTFHSDTAGGSGAVNGSVLAGYCGVCGAFNPYYCTVDCAGVFLGSAVIDTCGQCSGGTTNNTYNSQVNCAGTCGLFTTNWTGSDCLCEQLQYPPVVTGWVPGSASFGQYVGTVSYWVQRGVFHISVCGLGGSTDEVYTTLEPLDSYQSFLLAVTSLALAFAFTQALSARLKRPLLDNPYEPSLYMSEQPPAAVVVEGGGDGDGGGGGGGGGEQAEGREENDAAGVNEAAVGADAVEAQDEQEAAVGREVRTEQKEAVVEDGELYIGASELWRRRQVQIVPGREQVDAVAEEKRGAPQADDKGETRAAQPAVATQVGEETAHRQSTAVISPRAATVAPPVSSTFVPPVASPFAVRRR